MQIWFALSISTSLISVLNVENGAQFLNATCVSVPLLLNVFTVISSVTKKNESE